jgi:hypothetical protein
MSENDKRAAFKEAARMADELYQQMDNATLDCGCHWKMEELRDELLVLACEHNWHPYQASVVQRADAPEKERCSKCETIRDAVNDVARFFEPTELLFLSEPPVTIFADQENFPPAGKSQAAIRKAAVKAVSESMNRTFNQIAFGEPGQKGQVYTACPDCGEDVHDHCVYCSDCADANHAECDKHAAEAMQGGSGNLALPPTPPMGAATGSLGGVMYEIGDVPEVWTCDRHLTPVPDIPQGEPCPICR